MCIPILFLVGGPLSWYDSAHILGPQNRTQGRCELFPWRPLRRLLACHILGTNSGGHGSNVIATKQCHITSVRSAGVWRGVRSVSITMRLVTGDPAPDGCWCPGEVGGGGRHGEDDCFVTRWHIGRLLGTRQSALHCSIQQHWPPKQDFIYRTKCILQYPRFSNSISLTLDLYRPSHCSNFIYEDL